MNKKLFFNNNVEFIHSSQQPIIKETTIIFYTTTITLFMVAQLFNTKQEIYNLIFFLIIIYNIINTIFSRKARFVFDENGLIKISNKAPLAMYTLLELSIFNNQIQSVSQVTRKTQKNKYYVYIAYRFMISETTTGYRINNLYYPNINMLSLSTMEYTKKSYTPVVFDIEIHHNNRTIYSAKLPHFEIVYFSNPCHLEIKINKFVYLAINSALTHIL